MVYFSPDGVAEDSPWQPLSKLVGALCALFESDNVLVDKREMSFLYQMLTKPSDWFASCTEHNNSIQPLAIHGLVSATTTGLSMHNQIELSIPSRLLKSFGLSAVYVCVEQTNSNAQPRWCCQGWCLTGREYPPPSISNQQKRMSMTVDVCAMLYNVQCSTTAEKGALLLMLPDAPSFW